MMENYLPYFLIKTIGNISILYHHTILDKNFTYNLLTLTFHIHKFLTICCVITSFSRILYKSHTLHLLQWILEHERPGSELRMFRRR